MEKIKVFLSDPQILFREGIHFTLSGDEDFDVVGEATSNEEALAAIEANPPGVAILNIKNGKLGGPAVTRQIKRNIPSISVILVVDNSNPEDLFQAIKCGASACLTKDIDPEELISLIKEIAKGGHPIVNILMMPGLAAKALAEFDALSALGEPLRNLLAHLSPKEADLLKRLAEGNKTEPAVIKADGSEEGVRNQLKLIVQKLVANDLARATIEAVQRCLPSLLYGTAPAKPGAEYATKEEFARFREDMMQSLKTLISELGLPAQRQKL